jgi:DNA-binding response OmpR family regulator
MRILVIDDERPLADTLVLILERAGYEATAAYDGAAALSQIEPFLPHAIICDVIMPGMNGIEVCRRIQASHPSCHIILVSGQAATNGLIRDARNKICSWELLAKPVHPEELLAKLASLKDHL